MKWEKLGRIFKIEDHKIFGNKANFSQSPQVLCFENFIRIYFSTRKKDKSGKYLSHIAYVDFTKDFGKILKLSNHEIIPLGNLGCYDEHGIFPLNIVKTKNEIYGYVSGWNRRVSVMIDGAIGFSVSNDLGETFQKIGEGPILAPNLKEPFLIADPFVRLYNGIFHMWYIFGEKWVYCDKDKWPERIYKIAYASSLDGINWNREGKFIVNNALTEDECQALPTVIEIGDTYHMYFSFRYAKDFRNKERGYRIGHAYSKDLRNWTRNDSELNIFTSNNSEEWDSEMICYPHVFESENQIYMLYNGNQFGKYGFGLAKLIK